MAADRVEQSDWTDPDPITWVAALDRAITANGPETVLVAHSLGVLTVAQWAARRSRARVSGAFLVAPPDPDFCAIDAIARFSGAIDSTLDFPAVLVGSENDHYATLDRVQSMARNWRCEFWNAGRVGHINVASGHGPWFEGRARLDDFLISLSRMPSVVAA